MTSWISVAQWRAFDTFLLHLQTPQLFRLSSGSLPFHLPWPSGGATGGNPWLPFLRGFPCLDLPLGRWGSDALVGPAKRQHKTKMADFPAVCNVETPVHGHNPVDSCLKVITPKSNQEKTWLSMFNFSALFLHLLCRCSLAQMVGLYKWVALRWGNMSFHFDRQKDSYAEGNREKAYCLKSLSACEQSIQIAIQAIQTKSGFVPCLTMSHILAFSNLSFHSMGFHSICLTISTRLSSNTRH